MLHAIGQIFLAAVLIIVCAAVLRRVAMAAFGSGGPARGGSRAAMRQPGVPRAARGGTGRSVIAAVTHPGNGQIRAKAKADVQTTWHKAMAADWLKQRDHERKNGTAVSGILSTPGTVAATKPTIRQRLRLAPYDPPAQGPGGNGTAAGPDGGGNGRGEYEPGAVARRFAAAGVTVSVEPGPGGRAPAAAPQPAPASTDGGTPVAAGTSTASAEKLTEGVNEIYAHAASGGLTAKQEAVRAAREAAVRFAGMMQMLARTMSEPGSNYGPEITEPISKGGTQFQAGAMLLSDADNALETLANMTLREASTSPRQVPHHQNELSESRGH